MRVFRFVNVAILSTLVAGSAALYAQDEKQQQEDKPRQEEPKRHEAPKQAQEPKREEQSHPAARQDEMKAPRQEQAKPPKDERQEPKQEQKEENRQGREMTPGQPQGHSGPARKSAHITEEKFHAQFGREHHFAVRRPVVVEGSPGFFYGGYSFVMVDAWPAEWAYDDDCYVDYIDGEYFLFDLRHPGVRIALMVVE
jgi:DNA mismatch repair ATPase MutL